MDEPEKQLAKTMIGKRTSESVPGARCLLIEMFERRRWCRVTFLFISCVAAFGIIYFGMFCPDSVCALSASGPTPPYPYAYQIKHRDESFYTFGDHTQRQKEISSRTRVDTQRRLNDDSRDNSYDVDNEKFNIDDEDVLVFLHIQKTGGTTFGRHLVKNLDLKEPCRCYKGRKRCDCERGKDRHIWLFSRFSTGWSCGLHADWTELINCVPEQLDKRESGPRKRRYSLHYITILRNPLQRYLSEWKHVQRGATWMTAKLKCNGRSATLDEVPFCFSGETWEGVTLQEFMSCKYNLANNRQARMLANLSLVNCYNETSMTAAERDAVILQSAKDNLRQMAWFGLTDFQPETQYSFQKTFGLFFRDDFEQRNATHASKLDITEEQRLQILKINHLDIELYKYARQLFLDRLDKLRQEDGLSPKSSDLFRFQSNGLNFQSQDSVR